MGTGFLYEESAEDWGVGGECDRHNSILKARADERQWEKVARLHTSLVLLGFLHPTTAFFSRDSFELAQESRPDQRRPVPHTAFPTRLFIRTTHTFPHLVALLVMGDRFQLNQHNTQTKQQLLQHYSRLKQH